MAKLEEKTEDDPKTKKIKDSPIKEIKSKVMKELQDNYTGLKRQQHIEKLIENQNVKASRVGRCYASAHS